MGVYESIFMWIGVVFVGLCVLVGLACLSTFAINYAWEKIKDGRTLSEVSKIINSRSKSHD